MAEEPTPDTTNTSGTTPPPCAYGQAVWDPGVNKWQCPPAPNTGTTGACPQPGQIKDPTTGQCKCPPGQTIHGNSGRGCEPEGGELCDPAAHPAFNSKKGRIDETNPEANCYWCDFESRTWKKGYCGPGSSAGTAPGAGVPRTAAAPGFNPGSFPSGDISKQLEAIIRGDLNAPSRFTPEVMQRLFGAVTQQSSERIKRGQRDVLTQAARAGQSGRWGSVQAGLRAVQAGAETERGKLNLQVDMNKINADFTDKQAALDRAQKFLDGLRDNEYRYTLLGEQRRQFDANLVLGYANLAQQKSLLQMQLQSQWDMLRATQGFLALLYGNQ